MLSVRSSWLLGACLLAVGAWAQNANATAEKPAATAQEVVNDTTQRVMAVVVEASEYADEDPERYYQQVQAILDPVIDFRGFARSVM